MPTYVLRHIDRSLWVRVKAALGSSQSPKDLIEELLRAWLAERVSVRPKRDRRLYAQDRDVDGEATYQSYKAARSASPDTTAAHWRLLFGAELADRMAQRFERERAAL